MPWQAGGTFNRLYSWNADASAGFDILADRMDDDTNDIVSGVERCRNLDGYNLPSINLPMGGFRHTGVGAATGNDQYARFDQVMQPSGGTFTGPVTFTSITATGATINGALGVTGTATLGAASIGAGAVSLNNTGISTPALNSSGAGSFGSLTVSGNFSGTGGTNSLSSLTIASNLVVDGNADVAALTVPGNIVCTGGASSISWLTISNNLVVDGDTDMAALTVSGNISCTGGSSSISWLTISNNLVVGGTVDAHGGFYVNGTPHMLSGTFGSLFQTLLDAPDGASLVITKEDGQFAARAVGLAPADAQGRRNLFVQEV